MRAEKRPPAAVRLGDEMNAVSSAMERRAGSKEAVTIVMPARNAENTILTAVSSILSQTHRSFELVIYDDASTDGTPRILATLDDPRIRVLRGDQCLGPGVSRDLAIADSRAPWIAFIDADDAWEPNRLEVLMKAANTHAADFVFDDLMTCETGASGELAPRMRIRGASAFRGCAHPVTMGASKLLASERLICQPLFSRELLEATSAHHSHHAFGEDTYFLLKLLAGNPVLVYVPKALYLYRISDGSASSNPLRFDLLLEVLRSSVPVFARNPELCAALRSKIDRVERQRNEYLFRQALKHFEFLAAMRMLLQSPRIFVDAAFRAVRVNHAYLRRI